MRPYDTADSRQIWTEAVTAIPTSDVDPQSPPRFTIDRATKIASAGSCFAQRIAQELSGRGFTYVQTEPNCDFSARYGNIYTTRQLAQLLERATRAFTPSDDVWTNPQGLYIDPFRARAVPEGFASVEALRADRRQHLEAVIRTIETAEVFIFTLGLTETWVSAIDGAAYSAPPGYGSGQYDSRKHLFHNSDVAENVAHLERFLELAHRINPDLRVLLSVSPVPLALTYERANVLSATTYSKSVLRVAAEGIRLRYPQVDYVASYEIVTNTGNGSAYFTDDRRNVSDAAVAHVMRSFFRNFAPEPLELTIDRPAVAPHEDPCDEEHVLRSVLADRAR
jgi:hypothetical protein